MGWLLRDERNMRRHRPPAQHHEPPLKVYQMQVLNASRYMGGRELYSRVMDGEFSCGDCGWTLEGEWVPCSEHEGMEEPR